MWVIDMKKVDILAHKFYLECKVQGLTFKEMYYVAEKMQQKAYDSKIGD